MEQNFSEQSGSTQLFSQDTIDLIINENPRLLSEEVDKILSNKRTDQDILFVTDVDECITCGHLSKTCSDSVSILTNKKHPNIHGFSLTDTINHWVNYQGLNRIQYALILDYATKEVTFSSDFINIALTQLYNSQVFTVLVSSGVYDAIKWSLQREKIYHIQSLASKIQFNESGVITHPELTIGEQEKRIGVELLAERGSFKKIISLGHSNGDIPLIQAGTPGYRFCLRDDRYPNAQKFADRIIDRVGEISEYLV